MLRTIFYLFFLLELLSANNERCIVPSIILETIKITENETNYPYWIRTNESNTLKKFQKITNKFNNKKNIDPMVIDCLNSQNCVNILSTLVENNITNLDLGLFQINYESFKYPLSVYFDKKQSYNSACKIIQEKIKMNKGKWDWKVLASYHSTTPKWNNNYKQKLIKNYIELTKNQNIKNYIQIVSHEDILIIE